MNRVLVIGARGLVGSKIVESLSERYAVRAVDKDELDVTNLDRYTALLDELRPNFVINASGFLNADRCENEYIDSYRVNVGGVINLVQALRRVGLEDDCGVVHFSSDFVFDGKRGNYTESDIPNPISVYGMHKWIADEILLSSRLRRFYILRTASVLGYNKCRPNFLRTVLAQGVKNGEVSVVSDLRISLSTVEYIAETIDSFLRLFPNAGLYNCVSTGHTSWFRVAEFAFAKLGLQVTLKEITTTDYKVVARRPPNSTLDPSKLSALVAKIPSWEHLLEDHLNANWDKYQKEIAQAEI